MAKQKHPRKPLVGSVATRLKSTQFSNGVEVTTPEETKQRKQEFLSVLDTAIVQFKQNLAKGKVGLDSTLDLERLIKLTLLVSGEADSISGKTSSKETEVGTEDVKISMSKIEEILSLDDPDVKAIYDKLYQGYNEINDEKG